MLIVPSLSISLTPKLPAALKLLLEPASPIVTLTIFDLLVVLASRVLTVIFWLLEMSTFIRLERPA